MALIIKGECIDVKDGACAKVCPVDCIYEGGRMFYIHPVECVECGICESICPVDAIRYDDEVEAEDVDFIRINREYFELGDRPWRGGGLVKGNNHRHGPPGSRRHAAK